MSLPRLLPGLAVLAVAPTLVAAPVPLKPPADAPLERYLLDDADCVTVVNVKQVVAAPLFARHFKKKLATWLASEPLAPFLKGTGLDPFKDIDRVVLVLGRSCHSDKAGASGGPVLLVQGRFDPALLHRKMAQLARDMPKAVALQEVGRNKFYKYGAGSGENFAAVLDRSTLMLAGRKEHIVAALLKAAGKKRTAFVHKGVPALIKALKPDLAVQAFGLETMVTNTSHTFSKGNGGDTIESVKHHTLGDSGFRSFSVRIAVKGDARVRVELAGKNKTDFERTCKQVTEGFDLVKQLVKQQVLQKPEQAPLSRAIDSVKVKKGSECSPSRQR
jgi:hypothetical protein